MKSRRLEIAEDMLKRYSGDKAEDVAGACGIIAKHVATLGALQPEAEAFGSYWHNPGDQPQAKMGERK